MSPLLTLLLVAATVAATPRTARVTYLAGGSVYVDAGRADGIAVGDTLDLVGPAGITGRLRVSVVSTHSAACDTFAVHVAPAVGQGVRYVARPAVEGAAGAPADSATGVTGAAEVSAGGTDARTSSPPARRSGRPMLRGRIAAGWEVVDADGPAGRTERPSVDLRLDGRSLGGAPVDFAVDLRSRRVYRRDTTAALESEFVSRLWRGSVTVHDAANRARLTAGRQMATAFSSVSLFDGGLFEWNPTRWGFAAFGGTQPEPRKLGFSSDIAEFGLYGERRTAPGGPRFWSFGVGGISSQQGGQPNRDFLFAQGFYRARGTFLTVLQEVDVNRGWRAEGSSTLSATSTFASALVTPIPTLTLRAGYDGRHSVRLWRDRLTPETDFDDQFRQGAWAGAGWEFRRGLRVDGDVRQRFGAGNVRSTTWGGGLAAWGAGLAHLRAHARYSENRNFLTLSRLVSGSLGVDPLDGTHLELSGGWRSDADRVTSEALHTTWGSVDADITLALRWYLLASYTIDRGDPGPLDHGLVSLSWRF